MYGIVVDVNDSVEVPCHDLCDLKELLEVVGPVWQDKPVESQGGKVAHCYLIGARVLHNLRAQVTTLDGAKILHGRLRNSIIDSNLDP